MMPDVPLPVAVFVLLLVIVVVHGRAHNAARASAAAEVYAILQELRKPAEHELGPAILTQMILNATEAGERVDTKAKWESIAEEDRHMIVRAAHAACTVVENAYRRRQRDVDGAEKQPGEVSNG